MRRHALFGAGGLGVIDQVLTGPGHTCVRAQGVVKCFGFGGYGVGLNSTTLRTIDDDGAVIAWGANRQGTLGRAPGTGNDLSCVNPGSRSTVPCQPAPQVIPSLP